MTTCQLTKLETALDQLKKSYPSLNPADAALLATALSVTGRHALAIYGEEKYRWPEDYQKLTTALTSELKLVTEGMDVPTKKTKATTEEEPIVVNVGLAPNYEAGEALLLDRDDLKATLSDVLQDGVEFNYSPTDIGWQWALDRANWSTISGAEISRRIKVRAAFTQGAVGVELGTGTKKRKKTSGDED